MDSKAGETAVIPQFRPGLSSASPSSSRSESIDGSLNAGNPAPAFQGDRRRRSSGNTSLQSGKTYDVPPMPGRRVTLLEESESDKKPFAQQVRKHKASSAVSSRSSRQSSVDSAPGGLMSGGGLNPNIDLIKLASRNASYSANDASKNGVLGSGDEASLSSIQKSASFLTPRPMKLQSKTGATVDVEVSSVLSGMNDSPWKLSDISLSQNASRISMAQNNSRLFEAHVSSTLTPDAPVTNKSRILDDSPMSSRSSLSGGFQARVNGDIAPNFEATNTKGMRFALNEALSRRDFVVLNFWSKGWCLFDNQTVKPSSLSKVYGKFPAKCEVVFISPDNAEQTARIEGKKETSLVFLPDPSMKLSRLYGAAKEDEEQAVGPGEPIAGTFIIAAEKDPDTKGTRGRIIHVYMGVDSFTKSETLKLAALAIVRHMTEMSQRRDRESSAKPNGKQKQRRHTITAGAGAEEETAKRAVESRRKKSVAGCKQQ